MKRLFVLLLFVLAANAASAQYTAVRVNALGLATGTVNAGVDVAVSEKWSVEASAYWNPISTESLRTKVLGAVVGVRRWRFEPHVGFFWGVHSALAQYRVGNRNKRYNGWAVGVGASAGYSWMLHRRWNFSLEGGIGLYYMNDTRWNPAPPPGEDVFLRHYRRIALAPAKLEASFCRFCPHPARRIAAATRPMDRSPPKLSLRRWKYLLRLRTTDFRHEIRRMKIPLQT